MCVLILVGSYTWDHRPHVTPVSSEQASETRHSAEEDQAGQMVAVGGPMANLMAHLKPGDVETLQPIFLSVSHKPSLSASDYVSDESPVGTSRALLHKTFNVANVVDLPFELPAHAATPKLAGTYRSFAPNGGAPQDSDDHSADVEFLLLTERQYADLLNGSPGDTLFSADAVSNGEVDFTMPPTFAQPTKYYLVFRNAEPGGKKRAVQADFRIDF